MFDDQQLAARISRLRQIPPTVSITLHWARNARQILTAAELLVVYEASRRAGRRAWCWEPQCLD